MSQATLLAGNAGYIRSCAIEKWHYSSTNFQKASELLDAGGGRLM